MVGCAVRTCSNYRSWGNPGISCDRGVSFHLFPKSISLRVLWISKVGRDAKWAPTDNSHVCSGHFTADCFEPWVRGRLKGRLKKDAVPTLHLPEEAGEEGERRSRKVKRRQEEIDDDDEDDDEFTMSPGCAAPGCTATSNNNPRPQGLSYHKFPKDPQRRALWVERTRRKDWQPSRLSSLCSNHFEKDCFEPEAEFCKKVRLRTDAVPTIFDYYKQNRKSKKVLLDDYYSYHDGPAICICSYQADDLPDLARHAELERCQVYRCNCCGFVTHVRSLLLYHKRTKRFGCEYCAFDSESQGVVVSHTSREHKGERKRSPDSAVKGYHSSAVSRREWRNMTCQYCNVSYKDLAKHMESQHNLLCSVATCRYKAKTRKLLRAHMKLRHPGVEDARLMPSLPTIPLPKAAVMKVEGEEKSILVRTHNCHICDLRAATASSLKKHLEEVHGEERKMYNCEHCEYSTEFPNNVVVHMRRQHDDLKDRYFNCDQCSYWTISESGIEQHVSLKHDGDWKSSESAKKKRKSNFTPVMLKRKIGRKEPLEMRNVVESQEDGIVKLDASSNMSADVRIEVMEEDDDEDEVHIISKTSVEASSILPDVANVDEDTSGISSGSNVIEADLGETAAKVPEDASVLSHDGDISTYPDDDDDGDISAFPDAGDVSAYPDEDLDISASPNDDDIISAASDDNPEMGEENDVVSSSSAATANKDCPSLSDMPNLEGDVDVKPSMIFGDVEEVPLD